MQGVCGGCGGCVVQLCVVGRRRGERRRDGKGNISTLTMMNLRMKGVIWFNS